MSARNADQNCTDALSMNGSFSVFTVLSCSQEAASNSSIILDLCNLASASQEVNRLMHASVVSYCVHVIKTMKCCRQCCKSAGDQFIAVPCVHTAETKLCLAGSPLSVGDQFIAGLGAGAAGALIACPTELIKCRLQV